MNVVVYHILRGDHFELRWANVIIKAYGMVNINHVVQETTLSLTPLHLEIYIDPTETTNLCPVSILLLYSRNKILHYKDKMLARPSSYMIINFHRSRKCQEIRSRKSDFRQFITYTNTDAHSYIEMIHMGTEVRLTKTWTLIHIRLSHSSR